MTAAFDTTPIGEAQKDFRHPLIICAALVGGRPDRGDNPHRPITPDEIVSSALEAWRAGAAVLHLHARDSRGTPTNSMQAYRDLARLIRAAGCDAVLNFSAGDNGGLSKHAERLGVVDAGAEVVSLSGGTFNCGGRVYNNAPSFLRSMAERMGVLGVKPEFEVFDTGQLASVMDMAREGPAMTPVMLTLVFGVPGGMPADPALLRWLALRIPAGWHWSVCCQSSSPKLFLEMQLATLCLGGNIRTGLEDTPVGLNGALTPTNADLIKSWVTIAQSIGRLVASPTQARSLLGLSNERHAVHH